MPEPAPYSLALSDSEVERYRLMARVARTTEAVQWERAGIVAGAVVADLGCGPGLVLAELADVVGPTGRVAGVDRETSAIETASKLIEEHGLGNATVAEADAWASGLGEAMFDVVNIRHVLAHNTEEDRLRILSHAWDVLCPGRAIYVVDVDLTGGRHDPPADEVRELQDRYASYLRDTGRDPSIGPKLGSVLSTVGFDQIERWASFLIPPVAALSSSVRPPAWAARGATDRQRACHASRRRTLGCRACGLRRHCGRTQPSVLLAPLHGRWAKGTPDRVTGDGPAASPVAATAPREVREGSSYVLPGATVDAQLGRRPIAHSRDQV